MQYQILVSVIIPLYNAENYIAETIQSVLNQTYKNIEVIIVDDGSSDNSLAIAKRFECDKVKVFSQTNKGVSSTRNLGLSYANGIYIQFLDADDIIANNKIEEQINAITTNELPSFICSNWARIEASSTVDNIVIQSDHIPCLNQLPINLISGNNFIPLMSGLLLKETLLKIKGFDTEMTHIEDVNLLIRLYRENSYFLNVKSNTPLFYYRNVIGSASKQNLESFYRGIYKNCQLISELFGIKKHTLLLENYWNIYINSIVNNHKVLIKLAANELTHYNSGDIKDLKFNLLKRTGSFTFNLLYRFYAKIAL